jgi:AraC-like DNA-binding protein
VGEAAHALRVSLRTLQRRLSEADTTFHEELAGARLAAAQRLMLDSDAALTTIALEVGCASLQHFSALFRRLAGQSPSAWRQSQRAASAERGGR